MAFIKFNNSETLVQASVIPVTNTIVRIETETEPNLSGFVLYLDEEMNYPMSNDEYMGYTTLYNKYPGGYELSNDGSVWEDDTVSETYIPTVTFETHIGILSGQSEQQVSNFKDLTIPTVITEDGYEFKGWSQEIPSEGKINSNITFYAVVEDKNIYFNTTVGGSLQGNTKQTVNNYDELVVPTPIADDGYDFVKWMPEIPENGQVNINNTNFCALFESNIVKRLATLESDLTDAQIGLVENYNSIVSTNKDVTDCQLALVEIYNATTNMEE
jgi:hypothetical protein